MLSGVGDNGVPSLHSGRSWALGGGQPTQGLPESEPHLCKTVSTPAYRYIICAGKRNCLKGERKVKVKRSSLFHEMEKVI